MAEIISLKTWSINRIDNWKKLLIFTLISLLAIHAHIMYLADYSWANYNQMFINVLLTYPIIIFAWITVVPAAILKKLVPKTISIDSAKSIAFTYPNGKTKELKSTQYAFTYHRYSFHSVFILYQIDVATRGHLIKRECLVLTGMRFGQGWNTHRLDEITEHLTKIGTEFINAEDKPFLSRLLE